MWFPSPSEWRKAAVARDIGTREDFSAMSASIRNGNYLWLRKRPLLKGRQLGSHCSRRRLERTHLPSSRLYATCPMIEFERTVNGVSHPSRDLRLNSRRIHHHSDPFASALAASILDCACRPAPSSQNEEFGERGATYHGKASSMAEPRQSSFRNGPNRLQLIVNSTDEMLMLKRHSIEDALPRLTRQLISRNL